MPAGFHIASGYVDVDVEFDAGNMLRRIGSALSRAGSAGGKTFMAALKASAVVNAGQFASALATELSAAIGAVGVLPAVGLAAASVMNALKVAMVGVGDALKAGLSGDTEAFAEALKNLEGPAYTVVKTLAALKPVLDGIRKSVQTAFFDHFEDQVKPVASVWLPLLGTHLQGVAKSLGLMLGNIGRVGLELPFIASMEMAFARVREAIDNVTSGIPNIVRALGPLFEVSASFLPGLTSGFEDMTARFSAWMERIASDGSLQQWIADGLSALGDLGHTLGQIASLVKTVFTGLAMGGGSVLTVIGDLAERLNLFLQTAEGAIVLDALAQTLGVIGGILGDLIEGIGPAVGTVLLALGSGLVALSTAAGPVGDALSAILTALAPLLPMLGTTLAAALTVAAGMFQALAPSIGVLVGFFSELAQAVVPLLTAAFMQLVAQALPGVITMATAFMNALMPLIPVITQIVNEVLVGMMPSLIQLAATVSEKLIPAFLEIVAVMGEAMLKALLDVLPKLPEMIDSGIRLAEAMTDLFIAITPIIPVLVDLANKAIVMMQNSGALEGAIVVLTHVMNAVATAIRVVTVAIDSAKNAFKGLQSAADALGGAIRGGLASAMNVLRGLGSAVSGALSGAGSWLVSAGRAIMDGLISGIRSAIGALKATLSSVTNLIPDWKGPLDTDRKLLRPAGRAIMGGLMRGIDDQVPRLRDQLGGLTASLPGMAVNVRRNGDGYSAGNTYHVQVTVDPTKIKTIDDLARLIQTLTPTARQFSARGMSTPNGAML